MSRPTVAPAAWLPREPRAAHTVPAASQHAQASSPGADGDVDEGCGGGRGGGGAIPHGSGGGKRPSCHGAPALRSRRRCSSTCWGLALPRPEEGRGGPAGPTQAAAAGSGRCCCCPGCAHRCRQSAGGQLAGALAAHVIRFGPFIMLRWRHRPQRAAASAGPPRDDACRPQAPLALHPPRACTCRMQPSAGAPDALHTDACRHANRHTTRGGGRRPAGACLQTGTVLAC